VGGVPVEEEGLAEKGQIPVGEEESYYENHLIEYYNLKGQIGKGLQM
jgi:hypothetical protein